ncbi:MAG TPA: GDP-fucose synthetase [Gammaproteobacteria bacterium]|jgi:GDP-L-fucose synthase|nr:GDP-fucose synthetase [Gammaproteobacteria bacterium]
MTKRIFVAGHKGMVGRALVRRLEQDGKNQVFGRPHAELDLMDQRAVQAFFAREQIDEVYFAAAKVGGIIANSTYPAEFIYDNLMVETNTIHAAHLAGVQKLMFLGSSCIYPRLADQPISEDALLTGPLEPTNEPYAIAKIAGIKLCESYSRQYGRDYRSAMPTNLYGPNDNFHPENSHVVPALIRRFHQAVNEDADEIFIWGSGKPMREFMHVDDMASACVHLMNLPPEVLARQTEPTRSHINIGTGTDCSIRELAETLAEVTGFRGELMFDTTKPDGMPRKLLDISRLKALGWEPRIGLRQGLHSAYDWFVGNQGQFRG